MAERRRRRVVRERSLTERSAAAQGTAHGTPRPDAPAPRTEGQRTPRSRPPAASDEPPLWSGSEIDPATAERGLRALVGGGSSQVSPSAALRARDAARPGPEELARVEAELRIVRRNWTPRD